MQGWTGSHMLNAASVVQRHSTIAHTPVGLLSRMTLQHNVKVPQGSRGSKEDMFFYEAGYHTALFSPKTSISIQKHHPYTGILNSEASGDSDNAFPHCGDVLGSSKCARDDTCSLML